MGKFVLTSHYVDANLMETATYGSEFVAALTCTEQIVELRILLCYLGVPIQDQSYMFGDNQAVVKGSTFYLAQGQITQSAYATIFS
jgi:hypothetical protein